MLASAYPLSDKQSLEGEAEIAAASQGADGMAYATACFMSLVSAIATV